MSSYAYFSLNLSSGNSIKTSTIFFNNIGPSTPNITPVIENSTILNPSETTIPVAYQINVPMGTFFISWMVQVNQQIENQNTAYQLYCIDNSNDVFPIGNPSCCPYLNSSTTTATYSSATNQIFGNTVFNFTSPSIIYLSQISPDTPLYLGVLPTLPNSIVAYMFIYEIQTNNNYCFANTLSSYTYTELNDISYGVNLYQNDFVSFDDDNTSSLGFGVNSSGSLYNNNAYGKYVCLFFLTICGYLGVDPIQTYGPGDTVPSSSNIFSFNIFNSDTFEAGVVNFYQTSSGSNTYNFDQIFQLNGLTVLDIQNGDPLNIVLTSLPTVFLQNQYYQTNTYLCSPLANATFLYIENNNYIYFTLVNSNVNTNDAIIFNNPTYTSGNDYIFNNSSLTVNSHLTALIYFSVTLNLNENVFPSIALLVNGTSYYNFLNFYPTNFPLNGSNIIIASTYSVTGMILLTLNATDTLQIINTSNVEMSVNSGNVFIITM